MKVTVADIMRLIEAGYESALDTRAECLNKLPEPDYADVDYWGGRADALANLKDQIENGAVL